MYNIEIVDLEKWEENVFYVAVEFEDNIYFYTLGTDENLLVENFLLLPMDYTEDDEPIFTDEYKNIAELILDDVVYEFETL